MEKRAKTGGRQKGTPNKVNAALKDMILTALDGCGGVDYLVAQANKNPAAFMALIGKVLPLTVSADIKLDGEVNFRNILVNGVKVGG